MSKYLDEAGLAKLTEAIRGIDAKTVFDGDVQIDSSSRIAKSDSLKTGVYRCHASGGQVSGDGILFMSRSGPSDRYAYCTFITLNRGWYYGKNEEYSADGYITLSYVGSINEYSVGDTKWDTTPTLGSTKPVTSDGIKSALNALLPDPAVADAGKVVKVGAAGGYELGTPSGGTKLYRHYFTINRPAISAYDISLTIVTDSAANILEDTGGYNYRLNIKGNIISACGTDSIHEILNIRKTSSNSIVISMTGNFDSEQEGYVVKLETIDGIGQFSVVSAEEVTPL